MILWINGAFGSGKAQTANELCRRLDGPFSMTRKMWDIFSGEMN